MTKAPPTSSPAGVAVDGEAIRRLRKRLGYTLSAFAPLAGISIGYLCQIERGVRSTVSPPAFKRIAGALDLSEKPEQIEAQPTPVRRSKTVA